MKLVIVESASKAQSIKKYLGDNYNVLASYGHISDLPSKEMGIDIKNGFKTRYVLMSDKVATLQSMLDSVASPDCDEVILASDPDREGSIIARNIGEYLKGYNKPIYRALFNEITKKGIESGIKNKGEIDQFQVSSAVNRRCIDRLVGYSCSPYLSSHYGSFLSAGRVQSALVKLIVDMEKQIESFNPQEYWVINSEFITKNKQRFSAKLDAKIKNKEESDEYINKIKNEKGFLVSEVKAQNKPKNPGPPLITVKLQQIMAKQFGWDGEKTMTVAQGLYEGGMITYLRTDSVRVSEDALVSARNYLSNNGFSIPKNPNSYEDKNGAQAGHECLRPTNLSVNPNSEIFSSDDRLVYKTIFEHFLASQLKPAIYSTLAIKLTGIKNNKLIFKTSGKALKDPGYLSIFGNKDIETLDMPNLEKDEPIKLLTDCIKSEQKFTQPPSRYNDATILELLESKGIGRPATYASIIKTITARNYVEMQGSTFRPTKIGRDITELLEQYFSFVNSDYTAKMETRLDLVAEGKLDSLDMLKEFYGEFKKQLDSAYTSDGADICICGGFLLLRKTKDGNEFRGCSNYPNCKITKSIEKVE